MSFAINHLCISEVARPGLQPELPHCMEAGSLPCALRQLVTAVQSINLGGLYIAAIRVFCPSLHKATTEREMRHLIEFLQINSAGSSQVRQRFAPFFAFGSLNIPHEIATSPSTVLE